MTQAPEPQDPTALPAFGMTTDEGNRALQAVVTEVVTALERGEWDRPRALVHLADRVRELSAEHPEVTDVTVRESVVRELTPAFHAAGVNAPGPFEF